MSGRHRRTQENSRRSTSDQRIDRLYHSFQDRTGNVCEKPSGSCQSVPLKKEKELTDAHLSLSNFVLLVMVSLKRILVETGRKGQKTDRNSRFFCLFSVLFFAQNRTYRLDIITEFGFFARSEFSCHYAMAKSYKVMI